jgi:hypothetical protein
MTTLAFLAVGTAALSGAADAKRPATPAEVLAIVNAIQLADPETAVGCIPLRAVISTVDPRYAAVKTIHLSRACGDGGYLVVKTGSRWRIKTEASEWRCAVAPAGVVKDVFGACV